MAQAADPASDLLNALKAWLPAPVLAVAAVVLGVLVVAKYFGVAGQLGKFHRWLTTRTDRQRAARRARFADHLESQMRRLGEKEEWRDHRYAELEAELEITGRPRARFLRRTPLSSLKRVPSLSKALEECEDRIVLLEGEPGSGKSVALRHLTQRMAGNAMRRPSEHSVIPIYVNLKTFKPAGVPTSDDVRAFLLASVNAVRDRDIERFLEEEFDRGLRDGTWLFLFDSFDEIPEILSATSANDVIVAYADAVYAFLHSMNRCRGVVASREFRGPGRAAWPTFHVVPLSERRKRLLVARSELPRLIENRLVGELPNAETGVRQMSGTPLFLGLLCEHMRQGNDFPTNVHAVLETYIGHRLDRDAERVEVHFDVKIKDVRAAAEELAFLIAARPSLGLDVPKEQAVALLADSLGWPTSYLTRTVNALIYTKIARTGDGEGSVTFSHRRLQEYFATCVVIREPDRVPVRTLLTSGRWRETAVTILQTQQAVHATALLEEAALFLPAELPGATGRGYDWPPELLHVLGILAEGGASMPQAGPLLEKAWDEGVLFDRKWALEVCTVADAETCKELLAAGFASESEWMRQEAFQQTRRVPQIAGELKQELRQMLVDLSVGGVLRKQRRTMRAHVARLPDPVPFERTMRLLLLSPQLHAAVTLLVALFLFRPDEERGGALALTFIYVWLSAQVYFVIRMTVCRRSTILARLRVLVPFVSDKDLTALFYVLPMFHPMLWVVLLGGSAGSFSLLLVQLLASYLPYLMFNVAKHGTGSVRVVLLGVVKLSFGLACFGVVVYLAARLIPEMGSSSDVVDEISPWLIAVVSLVSASGWILSIGTVRRKQRRQVDRFRRHLDDGDLSVEMVRRHLFEVQSRHAAHETFAEMRRRDVPWPDDTIDYLHQVAKALETRDFSADVLPSDARRREWVRNSEVLDQLNMFLAAQRGKVAATPR